MLCILEKSTSNLLQEFSDLPKSFSTALIYDK